MCTMIKNTSVQPLCRSVTILLINLLFKVEKQRILFNSDHGCHVSSSQSLCLINTLRCKVRYEKEEHA